ncbi:hypothetical protein PVAND_002335 [Polypedilum vanderplanki]|uniref:Bromodomain adjacent to zinc finger domain protein 1A n=1 Tax=Polypedilum vanderplanki TaxID=319348 RepID=A0A9J6BQN1_POLVA|nr:hypothetical protein PVAND_002335 [Polypedilum vanderplanki]
MPLLKRKPFKRNPIPEGAKDDDQVYYCEATKEVFKSYDEFFERVMLTNSVVWQCALTGRPELTYSEALSSEKTARKLLRQFPSALRGPVILIASRTKRAGLKELLDDVFNIIKDRYFKDEKLDVMNISGKGCRFCKIVDIIMPENHDSTQAYDQLKVQYKVQAIDDDKEPQEWITTADRLRRDKTLFTKEKLKLFLKQHVIGSNKMMVVKPESVQKYVIEKNLKDEDIFVGKLPVFEISKKLQLQQERDNKKRISKDVIKDKQSRKRKSKDTKQGDITKYLNNSSSSSSKEISVEEKKKRDEMSKKFREEMEAKRKEKADREAERTRKIAEEKARLVAKTQAAVREHNQIKDDLDLIDQRVIPKANKLSSVIGEKHFGNFMKVLEFLHSFPEVLSIQDKFPYGITIETLERALILKEVNGPLSDILQVLLSTIFSLQIEEENDYELEYRINGDSSLKHSKSLLMQNASRVHLWIEKHYHMKMNLLVMDSTTLSELIRLHLMGSGAHLSEKSSKQRFQARGGYRSFDDPGLDFISKYPHIIKFLTQYSVFQLSTRDILRILSCLIDQILTYSNLRDIIEDRIEQGIAAKIEYRNLKAAEGRRERKLADEKKTLQEEHKTLIATYENNESSVKETLIKNAEAELEQKISKLDAISAKEHALYLKDLKKQVSIFFNHQTFLGSDRAFRNYYIFESLPGLFVEHDITFAGKCKNKFVKNNAALANCTQPQRYAIIKQMVTNEESCPSDDKENKVEVNRNTQSQDDIKGGKKDLDIQRELLMCNCDPTSCIVHSENVERNTWTYYNTPEEIDSLIESLNIRGYREKSLREQLEANRDLIIDYIKDCPVEKLSFALEEDSDLVQEVRKAVRINKAKTKGKYDNPNFNCSSETDVNTIYDTTLRETLLEFEHKLNIGCLGDIKVKDRNLWRKYIEEGEYYSLDDNLKWGPSHTANKGPDMLNGHAKDNSSVNGSEMSEENETNSSVGDFDLAQTIDSGNCSDMETDDSEVTQLKTSEMEAVKLKVKNLAMALLQIEQGIDIKFIRAPFGPQKDLKDKNQMTKALLLSKKRLLKWEESLMKSTNFSQVFLHYNILYDSIKWSSSAERIGCLVCRSKSDPEQTLLCDQCNKGWHMYCLKPKLTEIPQGDWFCPRCRPENYIVKRARKRAIIVEESDEEEEEEDNNDSDSNGSGDDEATADSEVEFCTKCGEEGNLLHCIDCDTQVHLECAKPPAKSLRVKKWKCNKCLNNEDRSQRIKRRRMERGENSTESDDNASNNEEQDDGDEEEKARPVKIRKIERTSGRRSTKRNYDEESDEEVPAKKTHVDRSSRRLSNRNSRKNTPEVEERPSRRSSRKFKEDTPVERRSSKRSLDSFDTYSLSILIDEIIKHKDGWPFLKPVSASEVPDYLEVIKSPMDFSKIKSKLNVGSYNTNEQFMKDVELVFYNCDLYNNSHSEIYKAGSKLEKFVAKRCKELNLPFKPSDMLST